MSEDYPKLILNFEIGNEEKKDFCLKIKDNFEYEKSINYIVQSNVESTFCVKMEIKFMIF